jgi:hypothetical protein
LDLPCRQCVLCHSDQKVVISGTSQDHMASLIYDALASLGDVVTNLSPGLLSLGLLLRLWLAFVPLLSPLKLTRLQTITFICPVHYTIVMESLLIATHLISLINTVMNISTELLTVTYIWFFFPLSTRCMYPMLRQRHSQTGFTFHRNPSL